VKFSGTLKFKRNEDGFLIQGVDKAFITIPDRYRR